MSQDKKTAYFAQWQHVIAALAVVAASAIASAFWYDNISGNPDGGEGVTINQTSNERFSPNTSAGGDVEVSC